ncbi:protein of unknown function [Cyanobium sp. NIES-981]|nr:protein of unknown function [Cyanobium sp. NIES-981]
MPVGAGPVAAHEKGGDLMVSARGTSCEIVLQTVNRLSQGGGCPGDGWPSGVGVPFWRPSGAVSRLDSAPAHW